MALMVNAGNKNEEVNPTDENVNPNTTCRRGAGKPYTFKGPKRERHLYGKEKKCKNCKKVVRHFKKDCFSLEEKSSRPDEWKPSKK